MIRSSTIGDLIEQHVSTQLEETHRKGELQRLDRLLQLQKLADTLSCHLPLISDVEMPVNDMVRVGCHPFIVEAAQSISTDTDVGTRYIVAVSRGSTFRPYCSWSTRQRFEKEGLGELPELELLILNSTEISLAIR